MSAHSKKPRSGELSDGSEMQLAFDYGDMPAKETKALETHASKVEKIQERVRRVTADGVLQIGAELAKAQERLANHGNGTFGKWCKERCGLSPQHALKCIRSFQEFGSEQFIQNFDASSLYLLSAESTPEEATQEALRLAEQGERITHKRAKEIVAEVAGDDEQYVDTDEPEEEAESDIEWNPIECFGEIKALVTKWRNVIPEEDVPVLSEWLQKLATKLGDQE